MIAALGVAIGVFRMPAAAALAAAAYGGCYGLLPIGWIVLAAVFLYHLTVRSGQFDVVKRSVTAISPDRRMQALLIAFSFGTFLEGAAGFGTPVAISAALLIGLGFSPLYAAGLALLANTSPVAFGSLGTPIILLAKVSGISEMALSQMAGAAIDAVLADHSRMAGRGDVGLEGGEGLLAGNTRLRRQFRHDPVLHVELPWPRAGQRFRRRRFVAGTGGFSAILAAEGNLAIPGGEGRKGSCPQRTQRTRRKEQEEKKVERKRRTSE